MDATGRSIGVAACVVALVATAALWRRSYRTTLELCWRRYLGVVVFYVSWGQIRLYRSSFARPDPGRGPPGVVRRIHRFAPIFPTTRTPFDVVHIAGGGFTYASGRNRDTGVRYRVVSVPVWLLGVIPLILLCRFVAGGLTAG